MEEPLLTHAFDLYGHCLMKVEACHPKISPNNPATIVVAIALARPEGTKGAPTGEALTLGELTCRAESERVAQQNIIYLYATSHAGKHLPGVENILVTLVPGAGPMDATVAPETVNLV